MYIKRERAVLFTCLLACFLFAGYSLPASSGDPEAGREKADNCLGCHGVPSYTNVYPTYHVPKLAGQYAEYIISALAAYRTGERKHPSMQAQAHSLSDEDQADIAAYFSSLPSAPANPDVVVPERIKAKVATCAACHGLDGNTSTAPMFPRLAGQQKNYLYHALQTYKSAQRSNAIMAGIVVTLSEEDMHLLSAYYSSLPGLGTIDVGHSNVNVKRVKPN